ncbi:MAG: phosphonate metabolism protein/1,5-bisphosphokinase (PRPP-forming) PhnN [Pseudomonadota bacterium]|nr:phosphonate metabolism protein/1,5-bisphosphokinase (PRPP-forming) PhnN [Pseudomonadota bacterium]
MQTDAGSLVLVVGPSGAGKDSILRGAAKILRDNPHFVFPKRVVTRVADVAAEDHDTLSESSFEAIRTAGGFLLSWQAHGNSYGILAAVADQMKMGQVVVVNVSRQIIAEAAIKFPSLVVIEITAEASLRVQRIEQRGREVSKAAAARAMREVDAYPSGIALHSIENNASLDVAILRFVSLLETL